MNEQEWIKKVAAEITQAYGARETSNEGRARVCARRAAGWLLRIAYDRRSIDVGIMSAFDLISSGSIQPEFSPQIRKILKDMLTHVEEGGVFPQEIDLVAACLELAGLLTIDLPEIPLKRANTEI